jgi:hypothetical protein
MNKTSKAVKSVNNKQEVSTSQTSDQITAIATVEAQSTNPAVIEPLTQAETELLAKCEETIQQGLQSFLEVYTALLEVRDHRLYRDQYVTFEAYCRKKWNITDRHANRLMLAGEVVNNIKGDQLVSSVPIAAPENEGQVRELVALSKKEQIEAAKIVAKKPGKPTAKDFKEAAKKVVSEKPKVNKSIIQQTDDDDEKPSVQSYEPRFEDATDDEKPAIKTKPSEKDELEKLLEMVDAAQTQARKTPKADVEVKMLGEVADLVTHKLNGGAK